VDKILQQLADRLRIPDADIITADEIAGWPDVRLNELVCKGILTEIEHATGIVCDQCEESCYIEPTIRTYADGSKTVGVFVCTRNPDIGRITVDLNRLRLWRICKDKLKEMGFLQNKTKKRKRKISSELTKAEREVFQLVHIQGKTPKQAAIEMRCTKQNVSQLLKKAEMKIKAQQSRSISLTKAQKLPEDKRGQVQLSKEQL